MAVVNEYFLLILVLEEAFGDDWICDWVCCLNWVVRSKLELWMEKSSDWVSSSLALRESTSVSRRSTITPSRVLNDLLLEEEEWSSKLLMSAVLLLFLLLLLQGVPLGLLVVVMLLSFPIWQEVSWSGGSSTWSSSGAESSSSSSSSSESSRRLFF